VVFVEEIKEKNERDISVNDVMTASEVASLLKVSVSAVRRWTRDGKLRGHRLGGKGDWRYIRVDVKSFLYGSVSLLN
jgi:excisionase family DNA binding protein